MKPHLKRGLKIELPAVVQAWMKPRLEGSVTHPVYATWAMVYHMETAARLLLAPHLDEGEEAVSAGVLVKHMRPVGMHAHIRVVCALARVRGDKVYTRLEVHHKNRKIGEGTHLQVVVPRSRFARMLREVRRRGKHGHG